MPWLVYTHRGQRCRCADTPGLLTEVLVRDRQGLDCVKEAPMVKALCAELNNQLLYGCLQFHGGRGYLRECATEVMLEEVAKRM